MEIDEQALRDIISWVEVNYLGNISNYEYFDDMYSNKANPMKCFPNDYPPANSKESKVVFLMALLKLAKESSYPLKICKIKDSYSPYEFVLLEGMSIENFLENQNVKDLHTKLIKEIKPEEYL